MHIPQNDGPGDCESYIGDIHKEGMVYIAYSTGTQKLTYLLASISYSAI